MEKRSRSAIKQLCLENLRALPACRDIHNVKIARLDTASGHPNWRVLTIYPMPHALALPEVETLIQALQQTYELIEDGELAMAATS